MNEENDKINDDGEHKIDIETETESESCTFTTKQQNEEEKKITKSKEHNDKDIQKKAKDNVNPLFYEIGPFPRKPKTVCVQVMGMDLRPIRGPGQLYQYEPSRNNFVRLVFSLVLVMLLCTVGMCYFNVHSVNVRNVFVHKVYSSMIMIFATMLLLTLSYAFACSDCTRYAPCSYFCLWLTALAYSLICSYFCIKYERTILLAMIATIVVVTICLALAFTNFDFTKFLLIIIVALAAVVTVSLLLCIYTLVTGYRMPLARALIVIVATLINSVLLIIELQMILGGKTVELSEDDYAYGAFAVYTSIINIFLDMLKIMNINWDELL